MRRLIELINSDDERVAAVACNSILDRAFGKPKVAEEKDDFAARLAAMTPRERPLKRRGSSRVLCVICLEQVEAEVGAAQQDETGENPSTEG